MFRLQYLCLQPFNHSPSQRYRFEQFMPYMQAQGVEIDYSPALAKDEVPIFYGSGPVWDKGRVACRALARRALSVAPRGFKPRHDVVYVQREAFFLFDAWAEWLAHLQAPVLFDFDDAIWIRFVSEANRRFGSLKNVEKVRHIVAMSQVVVAGNDYLASWARQYSDDVHVIPTCVDTSRYTPARTEDPERPVTIGWCGSPSTVRHLRLILPVLERIQKTYGPRVRIRAMGDPRFRHEPLGLVGEAWSSEAELAFLRDSDIGLMPLPDDEWSKGKCGLKSLTSMACGAANVVSAVGVNPNIVRHGVNGFLARNDEEWFEYLSHLIENADLRRRLGDAGRETVVRDYSVVRWREPLLDALKRARTKGR